MQNERNKEKPLTDRGALERYVELTNWIRELSAPEITEDIGAENYRKQLLRNFVRIGELARTNGEILKTRIDPVLKSEGALSPEDEENLRAFNEALLDAQHLENLDTPLMYLNAERLMRHARLLGNASKEIAADFDLISAAYTMLFMTIRMYPCSEICFHYRDIGMLAANNILGYLSPDAFRTLPADAKERVLITSRYIFSMFSRQDAFGDDTVNREDLFVLERALQLEDDTFYRREAGDYDWRNHRFRTMQYICDLTERCNERGLSAPLLKRIREVALKLDALWKSDQDYFGEMEPREVIELLSARTGYLAGETDVGTYREQLLRLIGGRNQRDYSYHSILVNVSAPIEYMCTFRNETPGQKEQIHIGGFYRNLISYIHHMPKRGSITFLLTDLSEILKHFIFIDGVVDFEALCLSLLAALHPPTYVHSKNVADLSVCFLRHLIRRQPELLTGLFGCETEEKVRENEAILTEHVRHAALLHDVGKLFIVETILTYGRPLFDLEYEWIRVHPTVGAHILSLYPETAPYAEVARLHHRWYDGSAGYPEGDVPAKRPDRTLIAIVSMADCLDAATDTVGRSYKPGKTFETFLKEVQSEQEGRYAPFMIRLLTDEEVQNDIRSILTYGRDENYRDAYRIMRGV